MSNDPIVNKEMEELMDKYHIKDIHNADPDGFFKELQDIIDMKRDNTLRKAKNVLRKRKIKKINNSNENENL